MEKHKVNFTDASIDINSAAQATNPLNDSKINVLNLDGGTIFIIVTDVHGKDQTLRLTRESAAILCDLMSEVIPDLGKIEMPSVEWMRLSLGYENETEPTQE